MWKMMVEVEPEDWVGKKIVSQYGLVCKVLAAKVKDRETILMCQDIFKNREGKVWEWDTYKISLVTSTGDFLDLETGEVIGYITPENTYEWYPDENPRMMTAEEIIQEFKSRV